MGGAIFYGKSQEGGGGVSRVGGGVGATGREGVCREFGGGGAKYFFSGPKFPPSFLIFQIRFYGWV